MSEHTKSEAPASRSIGIGWVDVTNTAEAWRGLNYSFFTTVLLLVPSIIVGLVNDIIIASAIGRTFATMNVRFVEYPVTTEALLMVSFGVAAAFATLVFARTWWRMGSIHPAGDKLLVVSSFGLVGALIFCAWAASNHSTALMELIPRFQGGAAQYEALVAEVKPESSQTAKDVHAVIAQRLLTLAQYDSQFSAFAYLVIAGVVAAQVFIFGALIKDSDGLSLVELARDGIQPLGSQPLGVRWNGRAVFGLLAGIGVLVIGPAVTFWELMASIPLLESDRWPMPPPAFRAVTDSFLLNVSVGSVTGSLLLLWSRVKLMSIDRSDEPGVLYLRSFRIDRSLALTVAPSFEAGLYLALGDHLPIRAVRDPHKSTMMSSAQRSLPHDDWQEEVRAEIKAARFIILSLDGTDGVRWELAQIFEQSALDKTVFVGPPVGEVEDEAVERAWREGIAFDENFEVLAHLAVKGEIACATVSQTDMIAYSVKPAKGSSRALAVVRAIVDIGATNELQMSPFGSPRNFSPG